MLSAAAQFFTLLRDHWIWLMGLLLMIEPLLGYLKKDYPTGANKFVAPNNRRRAAWVLSISMIFVACFLAFQDEYKLATDAIAERDDARTQLNASTPSELQKRIGELEAKLTATHWAPLTSDEISALQSQLMKIPSEPVVIGCETADCKDLAESFGTAFKNAGWANVSFSYHGGFGITGFTGLIIYPAEERSARIIKRRVASSRTN